MPEPTPPAAPELVVKGYTVLEARPHTQGTDITPVSMIEVSAEILRHATDTDLDQLLLNFLGITPRSFWPRRRKIGMILAAASEIVDSLD